MFSHHLSSADTLSNCPGGNILINMSAATRRLWCLAASSIGGGAAVAGMEDQAGYYYGWNQHPNPNIAINNTCSYPGQSGFSQSPVILISKDREEEEEEEEAQKKIKRREACLNKVLNLSSWGPSTVKF